MNGGHDLGGMMGFGPVNPTADEPVFHHPWEARMFGLECLFGGDGLPIDASRHQHERIPPPKFLNLSYYERWLSSLETRLLAGGFVTPDELASGVGDGRPGQPGIPLLAADVAARVMTRHPYTRPDAAPARFKPGDRVKARNMHPTGHTRLPRYVRGHMGIVTRINGSMVFPDSNAHGKGEDPRWCYCVAFGGPELWGAEADPALTVCLDLWEPYLDIA